MRTRYKDRKCDCAVHQGCQREDRAGGIQNTNKPGGDAAILRRGIDQVKGAVTGGEVTCPGDGRRCERHHGDNQRSARTGDPVLKRRVEVLRSHRGGARLCWRVDVCCRAISSDTYLVIGAVRQYEDHMAGQWAITGGRSCASNQSDWGVNFHRAGRDGERGAGEPSADRLRLAGRCCGSMVGITNHGGDQIVDTEKQTSGEVDAAGAPTTGDGDAARSHQCGYLVYGAGIEHLNSSQPIQV